MGGGVGIAAGAHARAPAARRRGGRRPPVRVLRERHDLPGRDPGAAGGARAAAAAAECVFDRARDGRERRLSALGHREPAEHARRDLEPGDVRRLPRPHAARSVGRARDHLRLPAVGVPPGAGRAVPERLEPVPVTLDRSLVTRGLAMFAVAVVGWLAGGSLPLVAIAAGALMVLVAQRDPAYAIERVDWDLLLFFASLFVVMRGFEQTGAVAWIDRQALGMVETSSPWRAATAVSGVMATLSNLISNVPAVILWRNTVPHLPHADLLWRVVAMSSTFAGNLLLIGSMANLIVAEKAEARGVRIGFGEYARVGVPVTLLTLAWGIAIIVLSAG